MPDALSDYALSRLIFERSLALIYLIAFVCAANQFVPLLGEHGLLPVSRFVRQVPFEATPSLFYFAPTDRAFRVAALFAIAALMKPCGVDHTASILSGCASGAAAAGGAAPAGALAGGTGTFQA